MVKHDSAALLLLRFFLPAALLFATCFVFTIPSLPYFVAFLAQHFRPRYEVTKHNFPYVYLLLLAVYSALSVIAHIVLAALVAKDVVDTSQFAALAHALAIPDYKGSPWLSVKLLLAPIVVLFFSCLTLRSSTPDGEERFLTFGKRKRRRSSDDDDETDSSRPSQSFLDGVKDGPPSSFEDGDSSSGERVVITKFTRHMAGRGGIFWTTIACGFTGLSYSSLLTLIFLAVFAFVIVVWAFRINRLHPLRLQRACVVCVKSFRIFVMLYLFFIVSLQNEWFLSFIQSKEPAAQSVKKVFRLIGFVPLDTSKVEGWAYVTAFCAAVAVYVFSGIFIYALKDLINDRKFKNDLDEEEMGSIRAQQVGYKLSYYETQFLYTVLHLSSLGLLIWSLVFPGLLTLPMLFSALAYFASSGVRSARFFDKIIVYAILLQIAHFLFVAITTAFDLPKRSAVIWLLGLRSFQPQFTMNLVQALALGLFCTNIFCKRYIRHQNRRGSRTGGKKEPLGFQDFFRNAEFSATAKKQRALYTTMKVVLDQIALTCLYLSGGAKASALNSFFIISLCVLCFCQAFGVTRRQKVMLFLWTIVLTYSTAFLFITCTVCPAISLFNPGKCTMESIGVFPASSLQVVAYTATLVFSAIQVHFTWSTSQSDSENQAGSLEDFKSRFWQTTRRYFLFLAYVALLVYPLVYPANFLSYGYVLFLAISILVELLGPLIRPGSPSVRPLIRAYWPTVVLFSTCALFSRYLHRFNIVNSLFATKWVFGLHRGISGFQFTSGDASILIIVSLQGRLFGIDALLKSMRRDESDEAEEDGPIDSNSPLDALGLPSNSAALSRLSTGLGVPSMLSERGTGFNRGTLSVGSAIPPLESPAPSSAGMDLHRRRDILGSGIDSTTRNLEDRASIAMRAFPTGRLTTVRDDTSSVRRVAIADRERLNQFAQVIKNWRMSLPVKQTEKLLHNAYDYTIAIVRNVLLRYSYVLEACAILAAAVWLPGFSLFGAVYSIMGCVLLLSEQAFVDVRVNWRSQRIVRIPRYRMTKILPIVLAILSFALMSGQYVYSIIAEIHQTAPGYILEYVGFQKSIRIPIDQKAMLAHVLVFVTAFLQRVAVTWAAKDAEKINEEERQAIILPGPVRSQEELGEAVQIGEVLSGVGGIRVPPPSRVPMSSPGHLQDTEIQPGNVFSAEPLGPQKFGALRSLGLQQAAPISSEFSIPDFSSNPMSHLEGMGIPSDGTSDSSELEYGGGKDFVSRGFAGRAIETAKHWLSKAYGLAWEIASLLSPFWQKYGFDVTFMYLVIGGAFTRTSFSVIYIALVMALSGIQRKRIQRHWHHITLLLASLVLLQYFLTLGIPRPVSSDTENCSSQNCWRVWLYIDAGNQSLERKWDVTFAFLAVICASITLNAVSPGARGFSYWFKKSLPSSADDPSRSQSSSQSTQIDGTVLVGEDVALSEPQIYLTNVESNAAGSRFFGESQRMSSGNALRLSAAHAVTRSEVFDNTAFRHTDDTERGLAHMLFRRTSGDDDFTQRPISTKNFIKLSWMRFAGSLVQLYMFAASVFVTSIFSGVLLLLSFYFMFQFTNVHFKKSKFFIVRFYVLSFVFILVAYQAPFDSRGKWGEWAKTLGLYKTNAVSDRTGLILLYLMVSVWFICQMQSRIYESSSFQYVVKFGDEDANVRFKRAVHEHNTRKYEHMLGRNKNYRARQAREGRLERLKKLKSSSRSVDALYKVCVEDEIEVLRSKVKAKEGKGHKFSSHVKNEDKEREEKTDEGRIRIVLRFLFRGRAWRKYLSHPLISEFHVFISRYSGLSVYFTMLLAAVVNPSQLTALYPLVVFLYLILEQPRPPKQVWQFLMYYVCLIITGKYVVRRAAPCNSNFFLPQEKASGLCELGAGVFFDILIFLSLLWHRTVLYYRGLWDLQSSEEDMLLSNKIHGKQTNTNPEMEMSQLPPAEDDDALLLTPQSPVFFMTEKSPNRRSLDVISADQQCSDVGEVLKRARASIVSLVNEAQRESFSSAFPNPNAKKPVLPSLDLSAVKRSRTLALPSVPQTAPAFHVGAPRSTIGTIRQDVGSGEMRRFASLRLTGLMKAQEVQSEEDKNMTESQTRVQKSLEQWKVIPSKNLSLFRSSGNGGFFGGIMSHFAKLTKEHEHKAVGDYYILIFLVDFISFVFVTFGFSSIFNTESGTKPWWTVNFIEIKHLLTLIALFCALVMDRVVYLTRSMRGKLVLQYLSVILYHVVIFYMQKNIRTSFMTKAFYMLRCVYFLLSGLQIRNGFPTYTTAQFLLRNYNTPGIILFEIYNFIPFLWLMRTLLDWAVVPTSLEIFQYFRFVDIYLWLFRNRAVNTSRGCFQRRLGQQRRWLPRVYQGFGIFLLCAMALFAPFLFFSVLNPFKVDRNPNQATLSVDLRVPTSNVVGGNNVQTAYNIFSRKTFISGNLQQQDQLRDAENFLGIKLNKRDGKSNFLADFGTISDKEWNLPDEAEEELLKSLRESVSLPSLHYEFAAKTERQEFKMTAPVLLSRSHVANITSALANRSNLALKVNTTLPVYLILDSGSTKFRTNGSAANRTVCIRHIYSESTIPGEAGESFWSLQSCRSMNCTCTANGSDRNKFVLEFAIVSALQVSGSTILTLYGVILFTLANFMRGFFADKRLIIPYIDMPYTLHLYQLVLDIVYARQDNELEMEEILYNGLTDIYRDQHVMAKWSGERALKIPSEWWIGSEDEEAYYCYPSFSETNTEPYMTRIVE